MRRIFLAICLCVLGSASAFAYDGYLTASVYLRAGPDSGYPSVARLHAGTSVVIEGCVDDWSWCDVASDNERGWVSADYLQHEYQGQRVLVPRYGVQIGIPIITFVFGSYWDDHYRSRSWYHERDRYSHVTPRYGHARTSGGSHEQSSGGSDTYQAPAGQPRQSGTTTSQPAYQVKPSTTTAPQHPATTQARTPEKTATQTRPPVQHNTAPAADQQHPMQQQQAQQQAQHDQQQAQQQQAQHQQPPQPQKQAPAQAKSPPAQGAGKDKGKQGQGKDQSKDQGGGKEHDKDAGGGKDSATVQ